MSKLDPSSDWETVIANTPVPTTTTAVKTIAVWEEGTITYTTPGNSGRARMVLQDGETTFEYPDQQEKTTTDKPVSKGEQIPVYGVLTDLSCTANISLLR
jgi:hypothetical protein